MNEIKIFENEEFGKIREVTIDGEPWFVGKDIAEALGYSVARKAIYDHVDSEDKRGFQIGTPSGEQTMTIVSESGLYSLIFGSKLESAKRFKHWVTSEVLPQIRKTGSYSMGAPKTYKEAIQQLLVQLEENEKLELENKEMKPKAEYFDNLVDRNLLTNFRDTAKEFGIKEKEFIKWLERRNFLYRDGKRQLKPFAQYITGDKKYFEIKEWSNDFSSGTQTLITPRGKETFRLYMTENEN